MLILFELKLRLLKSDNTLFYFLNITPPPPKHTPKQNTCTGVYIKNCQPSSIQCYLMI